MPGLTVVVSPLISLMKDQVDALTARGLPAAFINSTLSSGQVSDRLARVERGEIKLLYVAPERFDYGKTAERLRKAGVSLLAIDEAHCISQWGHDFRPSYLRVKKVHEELGSPTTIALTATATPEVRRDITRELALRNPDNLPLSESDLLSYLVTGEPAVGLDQAGTQVAGLGVRALGNIFTNAIPRNVLDIVELQTATPGDPTTATSATNASYYTSLLNTRAVLGKQLGSRWFLGLSTGLCPSAFKENLGLQLEYRISSVYSAQAAIEPGSSNTRCDKTATPTFQPTQTPSQLGFDLFRNWRF
jgi:hypothetical protein